MQVGATYEEARFWSVWLRVFTVEDMADAMAVTPESLRGFLIGMERNGTVQPTGSLDDSGAFESIVYEWVPLPPGPDEHPNGPLPEQMARRYGAYELAPVRGYPIRLEKEDRRGDSTPGQRMVRKRRQQRYDRMQEAVEARRERQRRKAKELVNEGRKK